MKGTKESCTCEECRAGCGRRPGWMNPSQFPKIAKFLGLSAEEAFDKYFAIDWWENYKESGRRGYVIAPAIVGCEGGYYPFIPEGQCVFYENERCMIHLVKPKECAEAFHGTFDSEEAKARRFQFVVRWQGKLGQSLIKKVLRGGEPQTREPNILDAFSMISSLFG